MLRYYGFGVHLDVLVGVVVAGVAGFLSKAPCFLFEEIGPVDFRETEET